MIRRIALPAILFLVVAILGVSMANAIGRRYAAYAMESMAAEVHAREQEIVTFVEKIFQGYEIEVRDKGSHHICDDYDAHSALRRKQRMGIRERVAEMMVSEVEAVDGYRGGDIL